MQVFFLATKLSPDSVANPKAVKENGRTWMEAVKKSCPEVNWLHHYALFGQYDFISIYEAPDLATAAKVSVISMSLGAMKAESWPAIQYQEYIDMVDSIE